MQKHIFFDIDPDGSISLELVDNNGGRKPISPKDIKAVISEDGFTLHLHHIPSGCERDIDIVDVSLFLKSEITKILSSRSLDILKKREERINKEAEEKVKELEFSLTSLEAKIKEKEKKLQELEEKKQQFLNDHNNITVTIQQVNATLTVKHVTNKSSDGFRRDGQVEIVHLQYSDESGTYYSGTLDTKYYSDKTVTAYLIKATEKKSGITVGWLERYQPDRDKAEENAKELIKEEIRRLEEYQELQEQARKLSNKIGMLKKDLGEIERQIREWNGDIDD